MKNIFLSIFILATYNLSAQLSTSLSEYRPKTIIQDENCRIQFYDSTGVQVHELLCGNLKYWYEKSYPYYGGKKIVIFDGFNKIYIENDGRLTSPTFSALDDSLDVWKQCNSFKTPLTVDVVGIDSVRVLDSVRVWFNQTLDTSNQGILNSIFGILRDSLDKDVFINNDSLRVYFNQISDTTNQAILLDIHNLLVDSLDKDIYLLNDSLKVWFSQPLETKTDTANNAV